MNAAELETLYRVARDANAAPHGGKQAVYDTACEQLGISKATLMRKLAEVTMKQPRKQRSDAGKTALSKDEAMMIAAALQETMRKNGKQIMSYEQAIEVLRSNGKIRAERLDESTGEIKPLSVSAIVRALKGYGLDSDLLNAPAPAVRLASKHPNHVWQIDASLCVLYYLRNGQDSTGTAINEGLQVMHADQFYKNKPANLKRIENERVWRYAITDHASGAIYVEYVLGAESGENITNCFINAMLKRGKNDPFHGVPAMVMVDPGSANTGAAFQNLCRALGVKVQVNIPGNPRAKGQVENAHNIIERKFESGLKFVRVESLADLNEVAWQWMRNFNWFELHSRHNMTRFAAWLKITREQLRTVSDKKLLQELAHSKPESRKVSTFLTVSFLGKEFDVSHIPQIMVGETLMMARNVWRPEAAQVISKDSEGNEVFYVVEAIAKNEFGFSENAVPIGEAYARHADTPAQTAIKDIEKLATGADTLEQAKAKRKQKALPFGGSIDPYIGLDDSKLPDAIGKLGTAVEVTKTKVVYDLLPVFEAAFKHIKPRLEAAGMTWTAEHLQWLQQRYAAGIDNDEAVFDGIVQTMKGTKAVPLKAVGGVK